MDGRLMKFYKDTDNKWYADVPEWTGDKWELEMVCGADTMLEIMAQGEEEVFLNLTTEDPRGNPENPGYVPIRLHIDTLTKIKDTPDIGGATYMMKSWRGMEFNLEIWLCHVTSFVFGELPETIYIF
jgi:hypothetical protein